MQSAQKGSQNAYGNVTNQTALLFEPPCCVKYKTGRFRETSILVRFPVCVSERVYSVFQNTYKCGNKNTC